MLCNIFAFRRAAHRQTAKSFSDFRSLDFAQRNHRSWFTACLAGVFFSVITSGITFKMISFVAAFKPLLFRKSKTHSLFRQIFSQQKKEFSSCIKVTKFVNWIFIISCMHF